MPACVPGAGDGELYVFGSNDSAQLGLRNVEQALTPARSEAMGHCAGWLVLF
jgi:hypothetical protein